MRYLKTFLLVLAGFIFMGWGTKEPKLTEGIQPGNLAPKIGQEAGFNGKNYVLLQFWAARDANSRAANALMHNVITKMDSARIQMISVSLDENRAVYEGVIRADNLNPATQFNAPEGKNSEIWRKYRLNNGFGNWLIDGNGVIVAKNLRPEQIAARFAE
ncbi:MAG: thioredoxin family protein [Dysgonamonadaceae bacterium]|jgi:hypothetical protein|nr:thioredoxin family protein [Dysgonamonadaceae bacterium]